MKFLALLPQLLGVAFALSYDDPIPPKQPITFLGTFSNMRYTEEHQYGYAVELWQAGDVLFGHFLASDGLAGDTPLGLMENLEYTPATGVLSFSAKLTSGTHLCKKHKGVPSRDLFRFAGRLMGKRILGTVRELDGLHDNQPTRTEKVELKREKPEGEDLPSPKKYGEWKEESDLLLKARGPKW
ncbi:hypothetical protein EPO15_14525 [bacterium]|nr:MAG: hypothetical protein EPO15_14525 [bacterium]